MQFLAKEKVEILSIPGLHWTSASPTNPGRHSQDIVRSGKVSITVHSALTPQGRVSRQGLRQLPEKQASLLAQSASCLQPVSAWIGTGIKLKNENLKM